MADKRFVIRQTEVILTPGQRDMLDPRTWEVLEGTHWDVWDTATGLRVPYGRYRFREQAERQVIREERKVRR